MKNDFVMAHDFSYCVSDSLILILSNAGMIYAFRIINKNEIFLIKLMCVENSSCKSQS